LTDKEKKRYYDQTGEEPGNNTPRSSNGQFRRNQFEQDINPEEIFNMFFGGGMFES